MSIPVWALGLAYWLHMLATITWIGGLATMSLLVLPAARHALDDKSYANLLGTIQRRLDPIGWLSLLILVGTGMFQMSANPNYQGFLAINNRWAVAILVKHLVFIGMTGVSVYLTWGVMPKLGRVALRQAHGQEVPEALQLQKQETRLLKFNLILGVIILALTALARAS
jgi:uncharacterized membrane protein